MTMHAPLPSAALFRPPVATSGPSVTVDPLGDLARRLGLEPTDWQHHRFTIDGHDVLTMIVLVTPEMAARWLVDFNDPASALADVPTDELPANHPDRRSNRRQSAHVSGGYQKQMESGHWKVSPQNIFAFDGNGYLFDGQHRLRALVAAGVSNPYAALWFRVEIGWPRSAFANLDSGYRRAAYQLMGTRYAMEMAAALRVVAAVSGQARPDQLHPGDKLRATAENDVLLGWLEAWPEMEGLAHLVGQVYSGGARITKSSHLALLTMAAQTEYAHLIPSWVDGLISGTGLTETDPRRHLRNRWARDARALSSSGRDRWVLLAKAWNAYAMGRPMGVLKLPRVDEEIPQVVGFDYRKFSA